MSDFYRFPHTPHLTWLGQDEPRDDKVLSKEEALSLLSGPVRVEEKIDGANVGFAVGSDGRLYAQNRGHYLESPYRHQFTRLAAWLSVHESALISALGDGLILFGEWCAARHSIPYERLPDWFLAFDLYDRQAGRYWSVARRNELCVRLGLSVVPTLFEGQITLSTLLERVSTQRSLFSESLIEGIVIRSEEGQWLKSCAKLVAPGFTQALDQHWRSRTIVWNRLAAETSSLA